MGVTLYVCVTCKAGQPLADGEPAPGVRLHAALSDGGAGFSVQPVECLSACNTGCAVALSAPGRWSYVYGHMTAEDAPEILRGAALYAQAPDGLVVWRDRPVIFRKRALARIPPFKVPA
jgi:predicted metal-binding protein